MGTFTMIFLMGKIGGKSAKYFIKQQASLGDVNGYIEEMVNGQKVVKVFTYEDRAKNVFDQKNEELCQNATSANIFANILMPIMGNIGNVLYTKDIVKHFGSSFLKEHALLFVIDYSIEKNVNYQVDFEESFDIIVSDLTKLFGC